MGGPLTTILVERIEEPGAASRRAAVLPGAPDRRRVARPRSPTPRGCPVRRREMSPSFARRHGTARAAPSFVVLRAAAALTALAGVRRPGPCGGKLDGHAARRGAPARGHQHRGAHRRGCPCRASAKVDEKSGRDVHCNGERPRRHEREGFTVLTVDDKGNVRCTITVCRAICAPHRGPRARQEQASRSHRVGKGLSTVPPCVRGSHDPAISAVDLYLQVKQCGGVLLEESPDITGHGGSVIENPGKPAGTCPTTERNSITPPTSGHT